MITKILSVSDVITNSSSEVFVMAEGTAKYYDTLEGTDDCIYIEAIDWDWIVNGWEYDLVIDMCNLDRSEVFTFQENQTNKRNRWDEEYKGKYGHWQEPEKEDWKTFCELHKDTIMELVNRNLYFVSIEDHFEGAYDVTEDARDDALWTDYRH